MCYTKKQTGVSETREDFSMNYTVMPFTPEFVPTLPEDCKNKKILYFDIETTGLSAQSSYVYLANHTGFKLKNINIILEFFERYSCGTIIF